MAVQGALVRQVGSLLGFLGDPSSYRRPDADTVARWLLEGQQYLASVLVPDALTELWRTTIGMTRGFPVSPGIRIVRVKVGAYEARHVSLKESLLASQDGSLFAGTDRSPKWWVDSRRIDEAHWITEVLWAPEGSDADVTFVLAKEIPADAPMASGEILLGPHFHPALVDWALARSRHADDDDAGAGAARAAVSATIQSLNALHAGRQAVLVEPGTD